MTPRLFGQPHVALLKLIVHSSSPPRRGRKEEGVSMKMQTLFLEAALASSISAYNIIDGSGKVGVYLFSHGYLLGV